VADLSIDLSLEDFLALPDAEKAGLFGQTGILFAEQFDRDQLDRYCRIADHARALHRRRDGQEALAELCRFRMALNFFVQPSSRTFMSFNTAQAWLGMNRMSVRDLAISSMSKGESLVDSVRTFISYVDCVVMRHADDQAAATAMWTSLKAHRRITLPDGRQVPIPIVNAGSGTKQHPTQALLDVYTLQRSLGGIDGKTLMLVGDLKRGRTVRSLCLLMQNYRNVQVLLAAPPEYQMERDILDHLDANGVFWRQLDSIDAGIEEADAVYMTRIQDEWDGPKDGGHVAARPGFVFRAGHLARMKPESALLHPLPKRDEIEPAVDFMEDPRVVYWRQERNGMWMRVAVLAELFGVGDALLATRRT
jgi:aspartate carbamoyltransferase catalytic subunit